MFALEGVRKTYSGRRGSVDALHDVTLAIDRGSFLTVTGPSGSGKTTLLLTLGGLIRATAGRVVFEGVDLNRLSEAKLAEYRNAKVGFVLQTFNLIPYLSALENVMVPMIFANGNGKGASTAGAARSTNGADGSHNERARELLKRVGLADRMNHLPRELSVGQQQRVAIARALGNDPQVILADEPTGNLDPALAAEILRILRELNEKDGRTVIMVTHSPEAAKIGSHHLHLMDGGIAPEGAAQAFLERGGASRA
jgi:putative ABC transport system ATP-binding protein